MNRNKNLLTFGLFFLISFSSLKASIEPANIKDTLLKKYAVSYESKTQLADLKNLTLKNGKNSVEALVEVMKNGKYPDKNRWMATFVLGEIMGEKSAPFVSKFLRHPSWVMRMASLKTLLALKEKNYGSQYALMLSDDSLLVRTQALENIKQLKIEKSAPQVWAMLYDKKNYSEPTINGKELQHKRTSIIKNVILTIGELKFEKAKEPLMKMIQKKRYDDIFPEIDLALVKITGTKSPDGDMKSKRMFWQRNALSNTIIE